MHCDTLTERAWTPPLPARPYNRASPKERCDSLRSLLAPALPGLGTAGPEHGVPLSTALTRPARSR